MVPQKNVSKHLKPSLPRSRSVTQRSSPGGGGALRDETERLRGRLPQALKSENDILG